MKKTLKSSRGTSYTVVKKLGAGGMADVFLVREETSGIHRAAKILPHGSWERPETIERFRREACTSQRLHHPCIVGIRDIALDETPPFFIMDFAPGGSLAERIRKAPSGLNEEFVCSVIRQVLRALDHAHRHRVVHRDIKPENILFNSADTVWVSDFGLARILDDKTLTRQGVLLGTPYYNSPELARGLKVYDGRCDLYSLGVVIYEMLTGRVPFDGLDAVSVCHRQVFEPPSPPRSLRPDMNPELEKLVLKAMEKQPGDRYQSAADMLADLDAIERGESLDYDPLPGVLALMKTHDTETDVLDERVFPCREEGFISRFFFGTVENPPEPAAGLLLGAFLAFLLWTSFSILGPQPQQGDDLRHVPLDTIGVYTSDNQSPRLRTQECQGESEPSPMPVCTTMLLFPFENRTKHTSITRSIERAVEKAFESMELSTIPSRRVLEWQDERSLSFSALFRSDNLDNLKNLYDASHFTTGVLLNHEHEKRSDMMRLEIEVAVYRFVDRRNLGTLRDTIRIPASSDPALALVGWLENRLYFVLRDSQLQS